MRLKRVLTITVALPITLMSAGCAGAIAIPALLAAGVAYGEDSARNPIPAYRDPTLSLPTPTGYVPATRVVMDSRFQRYQPRAPQPVYQAAPAPTSPPPPRPEPIAMQPVSSQGLTPPPTQVVSTAPMPLSSPPIPLSGPPEASKVADEGQPSALPASATSKVQPAPQEVTPAPPPPPPAAASPQDTPVTAVPPPEPLPPAAIDLNREDTWTIRRGQTLRDVLTQWSRQLSREAKWETDFPSDYDWLIDHDDVITGPFPKALTQLLKGFPSVTPKPRAYITPNRVIVLKPYW